MSQAFDKLIRPLEEASPCAKAKNSKLSHKYKAQIRLQGASNTQLEHAVMVLLQSLEDLSRSQYKGTYKPVCLNLAASSIAEFAY